MFFDHSRFSELSATKVTKPALKTYADTILFFFFGAAAIETSNNHIMEIGVGGSTYVLADLADFYKKELHLVDLSNDNLDRFNPSKLFPVATVIDHAIDSRKIDINTTLSYVHIDGNKDYDINTSDLSKALEYLDEYGIICQDDFGNNKWPTVTQTVKDFEYQQKIEILCVGESSAWLVPYGKKEFWINKLKEIEEFNLLSLIFGINSASEVLKSPNDYFFTSTLFYFNKSKYHPDVINNNDYISRIKNENFDYIRKVINSNLEFINKETLLQFRKCEEFYLRVPYPEQSEVGYLFGEI